MLLCHSVYIYVKLSVFTSNCLYLHQTVYIFCQTVYIYVKLSVFTSNCLYLRQTKCYYLLQLKFTSNCLYLRQTVCLPAICLDSMMLVFVNRTCDNCCSCNGPNGVRPNQISDFSHDLRITDCSQKNKIFTIDSAYSGILKL